MNHPDLTQNLLDILYSNSNVTYLNLSSANIQMSDLVRITGELRKCL